MAANRGGGKLPGTSSELRVRPLPKNLHQYTRYARLCDGRCREPERCTFAHNRDELKDWNRKLQGIVAVHIHKLKNYTRLCYNYIASFPDLPAHSQTLYVRLFFYIG